MDEEAEKAPVSKSQPGGLAGPLWGSALLLFNDTKGYTLGQTTGG
jgi:hypothetical protein